MRSTVRIATSLALFGLAAAVALDVDAVGAMDDVPACFGEDDCHDNTVITTGGGVTPAVTVISSNGGATHQPENVPDWVSTCVHEVMTVEALLVLLANEDVNGGDLVEGADPDSMWVVVRCPDHPSALIGGDIYSFYEQTDPLQPSVDLAIARAYEATELTAFYPEASPAGSVDVPLITQLPTWLWIDAAEWGPVSASASLPGVTATVVATPSIEVVWSGGLDNEVRCEGPGAEYDFDRRDDEQHSGCTLLFQHSSSVGEVSISVAVTWTYTVSCVPVPLCGGTLPSLTLVSERPVRVAELIGVATDLGV